MKPTLIIEMTPLVISIIAVTSLIIGVVFGSIIYDVVYYLKERRKSNASKSKR
jgi:hypothetical protein